MILLLLVAAGVVLGGIGFGVYLLLRPDQADEPSADRPPAESGSTATPATPAPPGTTSPAGPGPGGGSGSGSTAIERPPDQAGGLREVAGDYVAAVNARDEGAATELTCQRADPGTLFSAAGGREVTLDEVEVIEGPVASATVRVGDGETALLLENQEDGWCVAI